MKISALISLLLVFVVTKNFAQIIITKTGRVAKRSVENGINQKVYQGVDKGCDMIEEGIGNPFKKKKKDEKPVNKQQKPNETTDNQDDNQSDGGDSSQAKKPTLQT